MFVAGSTCQISGAPPRVVRILPLGRTARFSNREFGKGEDSGCGNDEGREGEMSEEETSHAFPEYCPGMPHLGESFNPVSRSEVQL